MKIYIGCSGYHYSAWKKDFYPADLKKNEWLEYYNRRFNTVEINNSFYKIPSEEAIREWIKKTSADFRFTIKANRYFTHMKKLKTDDNFKDRFDSFIKLTGVLNEKLGCILWQLPGNLHRDLSKLETFCKMLNKDERHVIEFRHQSWYNDYVYEILRHHNISLCILSAPDNLPEEVTATTKLAYLRFHGKKDWYDYDYSEEELKEWKKRIDNLKNITRFYAYFNNDQHAYAPDNAHTFNSMF